MIRFKEEAGIEPVSFLFRPHLPKVGRDYTDEHGLWFVRI